jgi:hypothetical protein
MTLNQYRKQREKLQYEPELEAEAKKGPLSEQDK